MFVDHGTSKAIQAILTNARDWHVPLTVTRDLGFAIDSYNAATSMHRLARSVSRGQACHCAHVTLDLPHPSSPTQLVPISAARCSFSDSRGHQAKKHIYHPAFFNPPLPLLKFAMSSRKELV